MITLRRPVLTDAPHLHALVVGSGVLDVNSVYAYALVCDHFAATSVVAVDEEDRLVGFVSAWRLPSEPTTIFVWQVAVDESARGHGIAGRMLRYVAQPVSQPAVRHLLTTITPDNAASMALFRGFARRMGAEISHPAEYPPSVLTAVSIEHTAPDAPHLAEVHFRIGPFPPSEPA